MHRNFTFGLILIFLFALPIQAGADDFEYKKWIPLDDTVWDPIRYAGIENAAILHSGWRFDDSDLNKERMVVRHYLRVRVLDQEGLDFWNDVEIQFENDWKFRRLKARTVKPNGETTEVDKDSIYERTLLKYDKYRVRAKTFAFSGVEPGDIVEYLYEVQIPKKKNSPYARVRHAYHCFESRIYWHFAQVPPIERIDRHMLKNYIWNPVYVIPNANDFEYEVEAVPNEKRPEAVLIKFSDVPPLEDDSYLPNDREISTIFTGHYKFPEHDKEQPYWDRTSEEYGEFTREFLEKPDKLSPWLAEVESTPRDFDNDVTRCVEIVRGNVQNFDFLDSSAQLQELEDYDYPHEVLEGEIARPYHINLTVLAMLRQLGYDATLFWGTDKEEGHFYRHWENPRQFDTSGIAVMLDGETRYVFPFFPHGSWNHIPWQLEGGEIFFENLADPELGEVSSFPVLDFLPAIDSADNRVQLTGSLSPAEGFQLAGRLNWHWECKSDPWSLNLVAQMSEEDQIDWAEDRFLRSDVSYRTFEKNIELTETTIAYSCSISVDGLVEDAGNLQLVDLEKIRSDNFSLPDREREMPICFTFPLRYHSAIDLVFPAPNVVAETTPRKEIPESYANFVAQYLDAGDRVRLVRDLDLQYSRYRPEAVHSLHNFFEQVYTGWSEPVVLESKP